MTALWRTALFFAVLLPGVLAACAQDKPVQPLKPMALAADPAFEVRPPRSSGTTNFQLKIDAG